MFDVGPGELMILVVAALLVFGPDRLPTMVRQGSRWLRDMRRIVTEARRDLHEHLGPELNDVKLSEFDPHSYVRRHVLDGLDLDEDDDDDERSPHGATRLSGNGLANGSDRSPGSGPSGGESSRTSGASLLPAQPPYDPDAT